MAGEPPSSSGDAALPPSRPSDRRAAGPIRLRLAVDDVGDWEVVVGGPLLLGQVGAGYADVGLHAAVAAEHAWLRPTASFHGGEGWDLAPAAGAEVCVNGESIREARPLLDRAVIELGGGTTFEVRRPDPASASLALVPARDDVLGGAGGLLVWFPGPGGRLRLGADRGALLGLPGAESEVVLEADADGLVLIHAAPDAEPVEHRFDLPLRVPAELRLPLRGPEAAATAICFLPPTERVGVSG